ncbi:hypothetical protein FQZ97_1196790 [compost metagenome]
MTFTDEQSPARLQQRSQHPRPVVDARQPVDGADAGVDEIESAGRQYPVGRVDIRLDELDLRSATPRQQPRLLQ